MDSSSDSDIPMIKIIQGSRATLIFSSDSDIPMAKITHGSRANPVIFSDSDIPLTISHRKRPTLAKMATAGGNLFYYIGESHFNPFKEAIVDSSNHTVTLENRHILARKRKSSPPQKSTRTNPQKTTTSGKLTGGNPTLIQTTTNSSTEVFVIPDSPSETVSG